MKTVPSRRTTYAEGKIRLVITIVLRIVSGVDTEFYEVPKHTFTEGWEIKCVQCCKISGPLQENMNILVRAGAYWKQPLRSANDLIF